MTELNARQIRNRLSRLPASASFHKQIGMRRVQEALWLQGRNPEREAELLAAARYHLTTGTLVADAMSRR